MKIMIGEHYDMSIQNILDCGLQRRHFATTSLILTVETSLMFNVKISDKRYLCLPMH